MLHSRPYVHQEDQDHGLTFHLPHHHTNLLLGQANLVPELESLWYKLPDYLEFVDLHLRQM